MLKSYYKQSIIIFSTMMLISCNTKTGVEKHDSEVIQYELDWDIFRKSMIENKEFDWNKFVEIEGQLGEDYAYLFDNEEAKEKLRETSYQDLYEATLFDFPVKQLTIGVFDDNKIPEGHIFYFKETERGLKLVGFENL